MYCASGQCVDLRNQYSCVTANAVDTLTCLLRHQNCISFPAVVRHFPLFAQPGTYSASYFIWYWKKLLLRAYSRRENMQNINLHVLPKLRYGLEGPGIESRWGASFRTCPDRPWGLPSLLYNGYRVSFPEVKRPGRGADHPPLSSAEVRERVELYLYSPSGPSWPVLG